MLRILAIALLTFSLAGACTGVKPWERGRLAKQEMAWQPDELEEVLFKHTYFSKEGTSGGGQAAGGGCGCN